MAPVVDDEGRLVGVLTRTAALRSTLYEPALDADRPAARRGGRRGQRRREGQGGRPPRGRRGLPRRGHRARAPGADARGAAGGALPRADGAGGCRQRGLRRRGPRAGGRRRRHRQGRRGAGSDVHDPDDDRCRPAPVLRGAGVRCCRPRARQARLGRRGRAPPARRGPGPGGRCLLGDDRLLVRGHARVARRPARGRAGPRLQGVVRDGLGSRRGAEDQLRDGVRPGPQGALRGGHLLVPDVPRPGPPGRRGPHRPDLRGGALGVHVRRRTVPRASSTTAPWWACSPRPASPRAGRCRPAGDLPAGSAPPPLAGRGGGPGAVRGSPPYDADERLDPCVVMVGVGRPRQADAGGRDP